MPKRRRYATRDELAALVAAHTPTEAEARAVLDALARLGVPVDALVKIEIDESTPGQP
jgi:hypothetical protein